MTDKASSSAEAVREVTTHSACGQNECQWIDCAEHQRDSGRLVDEGWCKMSFATLRAELLRKYLARRSCRSDVIEFLVGSMFGFLVADDATDDPSWLFASDVSVVWNYAKDYFGS